MPKVADSADLSHAGTGSYGMSLGIISAVVTVAATYLVETKKIGAPIRKVSKQASK